MVESISGKRIVIIGGGIGGLATSISLTKFCGENNVNPPPSILILEKDANPEKKNKQNYSLSIRTDNNAIDSLKTLGVYDEVKEKRSHSNHFYVATHDQISYNKIFSTANAEGGIRLPRVTLWNILLQKVVEKGNTSISWNSPLLSITPKENGEITIEYGNEETKSTVEADIVIVADGNRSKTRSILLPHEKLRFAGVCGVSFSVDIPVDCEIPDVIVDGHGLICGKGNALFIAHEVDRKFLVAISFLVDEQPADNYRDEEKYWINLALEKAKEFPPPIGALFKYSDGVSERVFFCYDKLPNKSTEKNKIIFVGDATHPVTPFSGAGACQALNDAVSLGSKLSSSNYKSLSEAVQSFDNEMVKRTTPTVNQGRVTISLAHTSNPFKIIYRNILLRSLNVVVHHHKFIKRSFFLIAFSSTTYFAYQNLRGRSFGNFKLNY